MKIVMALLLFPILGFAQKSDAKNAIADAEKAFNDYAKLHGIAEAFYHFAADDAIIKRENDTLIKGRDNIKKYYSKIKNATVTWKPDFVDVSNDATMAYTYGNYVWTTKDSIGNTKEYKGVFHTVWKKQPDGSWKYVWD